MAPDGAASVQRHIYDAPRSAAYDIQASVISQNIRNTIFYLAVNRLFEPGMLVPILWLELYGCTVVPHIGRIDIVGRKYIQSVL